MKYLITHKSVLMLLVFFCSQVQAYTYTPKAEINTYGLFLNGSGYDIPMYFLKEQNEDSYVLKTTPTNMSGGTYIKSTWQWKSSAFGVYPGANWYNEFIPGYVSFTEMYGNRGQCVAFAKVATQNTNGTYTWKSGDYVIPPVSQWLYYDTGWQHAGKMIAFFGNNVPIGATYPQDGNHPGHVGIFLKYSYTRVMPPYQINGFWIIDQNYKGTPWSNNPDGKVRKHLILINTLTNAQNARNYRFVNITQ